MRAYLYGALARGEEGHGTTALVPLLAAAGAILLAVGAAADDMGWLIITGGIILAVGLVAMPLINHGTTEKGIYGRLDELEKR